MIHHFEIYLFGSQFTVVTDHKTLTNLFSSTVLNAKLWRWAMYLQQFDNTFRYLPGQFNVVADCLSRQTWPSTQTSNELPDAFTIPSGGISAQRERTPSPSSSSPRPTSTSTGGRCGSTHTTLGPSHSKTLNYDATGT